MIYVVKCIGGFLDGNVLPRRIAPGEVLEVDEMTYRKMVQSAPDAWEVLEKRVPPPKKAAKKDAKEK